MIERAVLFATTFCLMLVYDLLYLRRKLDKPARLVYSALLIVSLYLGAAFVANRNWPDIYDLLSPFISKTAIWIDQMLTTPSI
jgi:hypothetical protein